MRATAAIAALVLLTMSVPAWAQTAGIIAGTVKDSTGAVLPGVTVEAASPALIEKVRSVTTDSSGAYKIIDLRPGTYVVTFTLAGFNTFRREGIELNTGFTASVDAEMKVGSLEETVTVTGASPVVDVQNVRTQTIMTREKLDALPGAQMIGGFAALTLGAVFSGAGGAQDVGGSVGEAGQVGVHKSLSDDMKFTLNGMSTMNSFGSNGGAFHGGISLNMEGMGEVTMGTNAMPAETETAGVQVNYMPKDGGNRFSYSGRASDTNKSFQSNNLNPELIARGAPSPNSVKRVWDYGGALGGPIKQDRLWFFTAHRWWGTATYQTGIYFNKVQGTGRYEPDLSRPAYFSSPNRENSGHLTWQVSKKDKLSYFGDNGDNCICFQGVSATTAPEATRDARKPNTHVSQASWSRVQTNRVLMEAGFTVIVNTFFFNHTEGVSLTDIPITEQTTGFNYNAYSSATMPYTDGQFSGSNPVGQRNARASVSYVTGSHNLKVGGSWMRGTNTDTGGGNSLPGFGPVSFRFNNGVPNLVTLWAQPRYTRSDFRNVGIYAQDQWTLSGRATLNLGVRTDIFDGWYPDQDYPSSAFLPGFHIAGQTGVPRWRDVSPRLGVAYKLTSDGKTAVKVSAGRYVNGEGSGMPGNNNPANTVVTNATRIWNDANHDFFPQESELGPLSDASFGTPVIRTTYDPDVLTKNRGYTWQMSASFDRQLRDNMGLNVGYYRTQNYNFRVTDNTRVGPSDFDPFCVTVPADVRLPGGGGNQICGLANVTFQRFGQTQNVVKTASDFGTYTDRGDFVSAQLNARFAKGALVQGGVDLGRALTDRCFVVDSPQELYQCRVEVPNAGNAQLKASFSIPVKYGIEVAAVYQNLPGTAILANATFTNAQVAPSLGRNLSNCAAPTGACNATVTVPVIQPNTLFEDRISQLDLRLGKSIRARFGRIRASLDLYNVFNAAPVVARNNTFGAAWGTPTRIQDGRLIKLGVQISY